jgi:hypothetical protein
MLQKRMPASRRRKEMRSMIKTMRRQAAALAIAAMALVLALTGTSIALPGLGKDSVGAKELDVVTPRTATASLPSSGYAEATPTCRKNEQLLGGGVSVDNANVNEFTAVLESAPEGNGWHARMQNGGVNERTMTVTALCLRR